MAIFPYRSFKGCIVDHIINSSTRKQRFCLIYWFFERFFTRCQIHRQHFNSTSRIFTLIQKEWIKHKVSSSIIVWLFPDLALLFVKGNPKVINTWYLNTYWWFQIWPAQAPLHYEQKVSPLLLNWWIDLQGFPLKVKKLCYVSCIKVDCYILRVIYHGNQTQ